MQQIRRALLVSYAFPPSGGAGIQRVLKLAKYLPLHNVKPAVLTALNPSVPLRDDSLLRDLDPTMTILRASTIEPSYGVKAQFWHVNRSPASSRRARLVRGIASSVRQVLVPDPQILWQPAAQAMLVRRLLGKERDDVVFISGPPFSQFLLAPTVRLARSTAVVLDYRDEWITLRQSYEMVAGRLSRLVGDLLETRLLRLSHAVVTATEAFRANLLSRFPFLRPERVFSIPNGYDPEDVPKVPSPPPADKLTITYAGTVFRLTSPHGLLGAVRRLYEKAPELARLLRLRFVGRIVDTEQSAFEGLQAMGVECVGYLPHELMMREALGSHLLLCLLDDVAGAERIYPAKIFELMALRRPCLTLAPDGALAELVREHRLGTLFPPRDEQGIAGYLEGLLRDFREGRPPSQSPPIGTERYDRRALAGEFAEVFRKAVAWARG
jgi:glycosyltransferase involved in cell wall biosynthesis